MSNEIINYSVGAEEQEMQTM